MPNSVTIRVFEIVPGNWTHDRTDTAWGPSSGGREAAIKDAWVYRKLGERIEVDFSLELQQRAKNMGVDLHAKVDKRDRKRRAVEEMSMYDPFRLSAR